MKTYKPLLCIAAFLLFGGIVFTGCSASDETSKETKAPSPPPQPSATEMIQKELTGLKMENDSLKATVSKLEQDNRTAVAHSAELETQLAELKEKPVVAPPPSKKPIETNVNSAYQQALHLFHSRKYQEASSTFQSILDAGSGGNLEPNCYYWLGECAYATKNYNDAIGDFQKVFGYARTTKKDDAQMMIANCYSAMGNKTKAKAEYQKLVSKYPASPYVKRAKAKLKQL